MNKLLLNGDINYAYVITGTMFNKAYDFIPQNFVLPALSRVQIKDAIKKIMDHQQESVTRGKSLNQCLICFDDVVGLINWNDSLYSTLVSNHRHFKISLIFSPQYIVKIPTIFRACSTYVFIFRLKGSKEMLSVSDAFMTDLSGKKNVNQFFEKTFKKFPPYYCIFIINSPEGRKKFMFKAPLFQKINFSYC